METTDNKKDPAVTNERKVATDKNNVNNTPATEQKPSVDQQPPVVNAEQTVQSSKQQTVNTNPPPSQLTLGADEKDIIEGESTAIAGKAFDTPMDQTVIERGYTEKIYTHDTTAPIEEPNVTPTQVINPSVTTNPTETPPTNKEIKEEQKQDFQKSKEYATNKLGEAEAGSAPLNPAVTTMSKKEKEEQLNMTVEMALSKYADLKKFIGSWFTVSEAKLIKAMNKGGVPPDWAILYDSSTREVLTLRQFIAEGNEQIIKACETSEEFKEIMRPILRFELEKRGWIASAQQNGMFMALGDLLMTGQKLVTITMNMNAVRKKANEEFQEAKKNGFLSGTQLYNQALNQQQVQHQQPFNVVKNDQQPQNVTVQQPVVTPANENQEVKKEGAEDGAKTQSPELKTNENKVPFKKP